MDKSNARVLYDRASTSMIGPMLPLVEPAGRRGAAALAVDTVHEFAPRRAPASAPARTASNPYDGMKRGVDCVIAALAFTLLAPILALIWAAVRATSAGPGLYWSQRVGQDGALFPMPKFRTMVIDAPTVSREHLADANALITPLGKILRATSLDELPQLWCVLRGDMSLIGPRPLLAPDPAQLARLQFPGIGAARPGLSGLAQIKGRNNLSPRAKARYDAFYVRRRSLGLDVAIAVRTALILVFRPGKDVL